MKRLAKIKDKGLKEEKDVELQKKLLKLKQERKKARRRKSHISEHENYIFLQLYNGQTRKNSGIKRH